MHIYITLAITVAAVALVISLIYFGPKIDDFLEKVLCISICSDKKTEELKKTGAIRFLLRALHGNHFMDVLLPDISEAERSVYAQLAYDESATEREIRGPVCGEVVVGVVEHKEIHVTVTTKDAFDALKKARKHLFLKDLVHIIYVE